MGWNLTEKGFFGAHQDASCGILCMERGKYENENIVGQITNLKAIRYALTGADFRPIYEDPSGHAEAYAVEITAGDITLGSINSMSTLLQFT